VTASVMFDQHTDTRRPFRSRHESKIRLEVTIDAHAHARRPRVVLTVCVGRRAPRWPARPPSGASREPGFQQVVSRPARTRPSSSRGRR
jgi:hypothetical protein